MKKQLRQTQHKPNKETKELSKKQVREIQSENRKLRRDLARVTKELQRFEEWVEADREFEQEEKEIEEQVKADAPKCPNCSSVNLTDLILIGKDFLVCKDCKWRKPI